MPNLIKLLLVGHSEARAEAIVREMRNGGYTLELQRVNTPLLMSKVLVENDWDIVISDRCMGHFNGNDAFKIFRRSGLDCPFITVSEDTVAESGAGVTVAGVDYLLKESLEGLVDVIGRELKQAEVRRQWNKANEKLQYIAYHDLTTDFPNRLFLRERIDHALKNAKRNNDQVALLSMKINRFRWLNETLGDELFDVLLLQLARRVRDALEPSLTVACLRSNDFAVLLPVASGSKHAVQIVHTISKALDQPFVLGDGLKWEIQASFGIALFPEHATAADLLLKRARAALGTAVTNRRQYSFYSGEQYEVTRNQLSLVTDLRRAIVENELFLIYQPKLDIPTLQVTGVEALLRWKHPSLGILTPDQFIRFAEQTGLIMPLTLWVLNEALRQCRVWNQEFRQLTMAVNLLPGDLLSSVLPEQIRGLLASSGISGFQLELEITETALMNNATQASQVLTEIKQIGLHLSVDDYGTAYFSLSHLHQLPIDTIKIDKSFVCNLATESRNAVIVRSTIQLAHNLGLKVIAEGVENRETLRMLATMGCDMAQGFYISHPRPATELVNALGDWHTNKAINRQSVH